MSTGREYGGTYLNKGKEPYPQWGILTALNRPRNKYNNSVGCFCKYVNGLVSFLTTSILRDDGFFGFCSIGSSKEAPTGKKEEPWVETSKHERVTDDYLIFF
jgi:hypothetical protein